MRLPVTNRLVC